MKKIKRNDLVKRDLKGQVKYLEEKVYSAQKEFGEIKLVELDI